MFSRRIVRISVVVAVAVAAAGRAGAPARAEGGEATEKVTQLNREALAAIDKREFEKARELLKRALDVCQTSGLEQHPITARTHVHMGVVIIRGFKNYELGGKQFAKALAIEPNITMTRALSTPEIEEAFAEARAGGGAGGGAASASGGGEEGAGRAPAAAARAAESASRGAAPAASGFSYHTVSEVKQGASIVVTVTIEDTLKFKKLVLAYRPQGASEFLGREMEPVGGGAYRAEIPAHATAGSSVSYYLEAQDEEGQPVASRGTEERPLVISFAATSRSSSRADATVERQADARRSSSDDDEDGEDGGKLFVGLLVGSGVGYTSGTGEVNADTPVPGTVSGALLGHVAPEVGYRIAPGFMLSLQGRFQLITGQTAIEANGRTHSPVPAALAVLAKATWFGGSGDLRPFFSAGVGGGQIRHVVTFSNLKDCGPSGNQTCVDSVVAGPVLGQVGGGITYRLAPSVALVLSSNAQVAAPRFTLNLDVNAGVGFAF
jgi:hypothetical protein